MSPRDDEPLPSDETPRPSHVDLVPIAVQATLGASPVQEKLVFALMAYLQITGIYVRSGRSSLVMQEAFDAGVAAIRAAADGMIRESTKSEQAPASIALHRWVAHIDYRHDDGIRTITRAIHELAELHEIVEAGPSFYAIAAIRIGAPRHGDPVTVEQAARQ